MLSQYVMHVLRVLEGSKVLSDVEIAKLMDVDLDTCHTMLNSRGTPDNLTLRHVDRIVSFFGLPMFDATFGKTAIQTGMGTAGYESWDDLDPIIKKTVNAITAYTPTTTGSPLLSITYSNQCRGYLDSCQQMLDLVVDKAPAPLVTEEVATATTEEVLV